MWTAIIALAILSASACVAIATIRLKRRRVRRRERPVGEGLGVRTYNEMLEILRNQPCRGYDPSEDDGDRNSWASTLNHTYTTSRRDERSAR